MYKNFYGYQNGNVETKYTIEYIDDEKTWEKFLKSNKINCSYEPWELFTVREYDNIEDAIYFFTVKGTHKDTRLIQLTESVYYNGTLILENPLELPSGLFYGIARNVNKDMQKRLIQISNDYENVSRLVEHYKNFLKKYHAEEQFKTYLKEQEEK